MKNKLLFAILIILSSFSLKAQNNRVNIVEKDERIVQDSSEMNLKKKVAIGRFSNETQYGKGIFYNKDHDPMAKQAQDLIVSKLASSDKFLLLERSDLSALDQEVNLSGRDLVQRVGADYLIIGSITEFGRKTTGKSKMFSKAKTQTVEATVSIRIVDVYSGMIIFSDESSGTSEVTTKTVIGLGGRVGYDATLSDKAISAAIDKMVENIIIKCTNDPWKSYFLSVDENEIFIAGGASQGLEPGISLLVKKRGKQVKNPQTGLLVELPGKIIGKVVIETTIGDTPESEISMVSYSGEELDVNNLGEYIIEEDVA